MSAKRKDPKTSDPAKSRKTREDPDRFRTRIGPEADSGFIAKDAERLKRIRRGFQTKIGHRRVK